MQEPLLLSAGQLLHDALFTLSSPIGATHRQGSPILHARDRQTCIFQQADLDLLQTAARDECSAVRRGGAPVLRIEAKNDDDGLR
jgi:hypothetical protein